MKTLNNKKGFTLVELLAVIVILAIIILIAMPNVLSSMERARVNAFANEAMSMIRTAEVAYSDLAMRGDISGNIVCIDIQRLGNQSAGTGVLSGKNYLAKNLSTYSGTITLRIGANGAITYESHISNGTYYISNHAGTEVKSAAVLTAGSGNTFTGTACSANSPWTGA